MQLARALAVVHIARRNCSEEQQVQGLAWQRVQLARDLACLNSLVKCGNVNVRCLPRPPGIGAAPCLATGTGPCLATGAGPCLARGAGPCLATGAGPCLARGTGPCLATGAAGMRPCLALPPFGGIATKFPWLFSATNISTQYHNIIAYLRTGVVCHTVGASAPWSTPAQLTFWHSQEK